jgi:hypothetical protein
VSGERIHLGGGLWASHDGHAITLQDGIDTITIGPATWTALAQLAGSCWSGQGGKA